MMKKSLFVLSIAAILTMPVVCQARDDAHFLDLRRGIDAAVASGQLDGSVKFYVKGEKVPGKIVQSFPEATSNKKTSMGGRTPEDACDRALLSALISFQENAKRNGANAVVNLESYYKRVVISDATKYECHAGSMMAGTALRGNSAIVH